MEKQVKKLKVSIKTLGCQMNVYDTQVAEGFLKKAGYEVQREQEEDFAISAVNPASAKQSGGSVLIFGGEAGIQNHGSPIKTFGDDNKADVVLLNTCSVREHAEDRVYGRLGMLGKIKRERPELIVGLMGCMVEEHKEKLFKRFPQLDLMVGTRNIKELPHLIEEVRQNRRRVSRIKQDGLSIEYSENINRNNSFHAWLPIMTGCNKVCTFCIVPITRGSEVSMPAREVYREASRLAGEGVKWITLLGQNVNSYEGTAPALDTSMMPSPRALSGDPQEMESRISARMKDGPTAMFGGRGNDKKSPVSFPELLDMLCQIEGLERISFTTSHPHDATEELYRVIARNPKISRRFHLPLQSGSDRILKRMKRLHTYAEYREKIKLMRSMIPDVAITTDIIAGFTGETEDDHKATARALQEIRYDSAYIYKYSVRPSTPAAKLADDVPQAVKEARHHDLLEVQRRVTREINQSWLNRTILVFAESVNPKNSAQIVARTDQDKKVVLPGGPPLLGHFQRVRLTGLKNETFTGRLVEDHAAQGEPQ